MTSVNHQKTIALWLFICCAAIFTMVVLGGITRLTGSGLSMVQWAPILGWLPPLEQSQWLETFKLYQDFPEYKLLNQHMDLNAFKSIFWLEYSHRLLGRMIGIIFFFPMVFFFYKGWVSSSLKPRLIAMFILGGLQGLLGWYMVKSGLVNNPHVSQYRLTAHLGLALFVYAYILWIAMSLYTQSNLAQFKDNLNHQTLNYKRRPGGLKILAILLCLFVFFTAISGGFVAGIKAGHSYNTFPLMNGQFVPDGLFILHPLWKNFFENVTTVQFDHRLMATFLFISIVVFYILVLRNKPSKALKLGLNLMLLMLAIQFTLGISTLLLQVPVVLAAAHQCGALILFTIILYVAHQTRLQ